MRTHLYFLMLLSILATVTVACGLLDNGGSDSQNVALTAIAEQLQQTSTAVPATVPSPDTPTVPANNAVSTAQAEATERSQAAEATRIAEATEIAANETATAEVRAPILAELPTYGVDPGQGQVAWIHPPVTIFAEGYMQYDYANQYIATVTRDFVLAADITWNTRFGTTGCGFVLRSDGDEEENFNQYIVIATRASSGNVLFSIMQEGETKTNEITNIDASRIDPVFEWQNDTTNRLAVVGRGNTFAIYTNGTFIGEVTPSIVFEQGFVAFVALNESGTTTCQYDNAWLWLIE